MRTALAVVLAAALLAGCSGRDEERADATADTTRAATWTPPPVGSGYTESLSELCTRTHAAHDRIGLATDTTELARKLPRAIAVDRGFLAELQRLTPPVLLSPRADRLVQLFAGVLANEGTSLQFLRLNSLNGYFQYMDTALAMRLETDRIVRALAAPACTFRPFHGA